GLARAKPLRQRAGAQLWAWAAVAVGSSSRSGPRSCPRPGRRRPGAAPFLRLGPRLRPRLPTALEVGHVGELAATQGKRLLHHVGAATHLGPRGEQHEAPDEKW